MNSVCCFIGLVVLILCLCRPVWAGTIYVHKDSQGVLHFTDLPSSKDYTPYCTWPEADKGDKEEILRSIRKHSRSYGVDSDLVQAIVQVESNFSPTASSRAGAKGLMQLMPQTQQDMGVYRPYDIDQNIQGGVRYLDHLLSRFTSLELVLAAYNAGPAQVQAYGGIPPFPETQRYVQKVLSLYRDISAKTREYAQSGK